MISPPRKTSTGLILLAVLGLLLLLLTAAQPVRAGQPYGGPIFDAMTQVDETMDMDEIISQIQAAGVNKVAVFARSRKTLGQNEEIPWELRKRRPEIFVLGAPKYFQLYMDLDEKYIAATIQGIKKQGYRFVGEILYTHGDKTGGEQTARGERYVDPLGPGTAKLLTLLKPLRIPLMTHWEAYDWQRDWPRFHKLYQDHPEQVFIIPHMAFASPEQVETILSSHPNVYMTISKKLRRVVFFSDPAKSRKLGSGFWDEGHKLNPEWRKVLLKHSNRLLFGTDTIRARKWKRYGKKIKLMRRLAGQLPAQAARAICFDNARRVFGLAKGQ